MLRTPATAILAATLSMAGVATAASDPPAGTLLFAAGTTHPQEEAGYPRVIRLQHAGADNGTLLATFAHNGVPGEKGSLPIYRSSDDGKTWSSAPIGVVRDTVHGWDIEAPALFELPVAQGELPAGTLFASGTAWNRRDFRQQAMEVFISRDGGRNWSYRSSCASEALQVNNEGHGIWEPYFAITADGSLNCFFSDERTSAEGMGQVIAHVRSTDGGATWGPQINDIGIRDGVARPGMPTVIRLPDGRYAMTFENCKANQDSNHVCTVYLKTSPDGQDWSPMADLGTPIATADGKRLLHTPGIAWTPYGGRDGTLVASGQRVVSGPEGAVTIEPASGRTLMINRTLGKGPWTMIDAPFLIAPTGGYSRDEIACPGYSSPLLASDGGDLLMLAGTANALGKCDIRAGRIRLPAK
ncbi:BNR repeat-like domain-containing protein [Pseudoxanthomonas sp. GM95]|uniref:sialidase family protein n=1 Tax=Pseudoxanthomonas sp. GM95 TaxID=1881043 RepID=UPI0008D537C0|nr:sialidase family protein [Pseudoxanthomonas sp. GM95]SEL75223.1 BNR repeat-like domain-containing protein [Pseudoxanthomonas sp. GM95]